MKKLFTKAFVFAALLPLPLQAESFSGKVVGISDGDTITVLHENTPQKIRILGVDCPEKTQPFGTKAKDFAASIIFTETVYVDYDKRDRYGRILGNVFIGGESLTEKLLESGLCWHYVQYSQDEALQAIEDRARERKIGVWSMKDPVPPWEFRRAKRLRNVQESSNQGSR